MRRLTGKMPDPKPATHVLCEPAQSKCTGTFHKSHICIEIYRQKAGPQSRDTRFVQACAVETHIDISQEPCCMEIYRRNAGPQARDTRFVRACAVETHMAISQEPFCMEILKKNAGRPADHLHQTPGLYCYCKNPFSVATLFGEKTH